MNSDCQLSAAHLMPWKLKLSRPNPCSPPSPIILRRDFDKNGPRWSGNEIGPVHIRARYETRVLAILVGRADANNHSERFRWRGGGKQFGPTGFLRLAPHQPRSVIKIPSVARIDIYPSGCDYFDYNRRCFLPFNVGMYPQCS